MTLTIKSLKVNGYYINIEQNGLEPGYKVAAYPIYDECCCGYPISENYYETKQKAMRQFNSLKRRLNV